MICNKKAIIAFKDWNGEDRAFCRDHLEFFEIKQTLERGKEYGQLLYQKQGRLHKISVPQLRKIG
jgi:hypothetical protein